MKRSPSAFILVAMAACLMLAGTQYATACSVERQGASVGGSASILGPISLTCEVTAVPSSISITLAPSTATVVAPGVISGQGFIVSPAANIVGNTITYSFTPALPQGITGIYGFAVSGLQANISNTGLPAGSLITETVVTSGGIGAGTYPDLVVGTVVSPPPQQFPPYIALSTGAAGSVTFIVPPGTSTPSTQTLTVANSGGGTLNWTATTRTLSGGNWLSASPNSGTDLVRVTLSENTSALAVGTYQGAIRIASAGVSNSPTDVPVTLTVGLPTSATIAITDGPDPLAGGGDLTYSITAHNPLSSVIDPSGIYNVTVSDPLPPGMSFASCGIMTQGYSPLPTPTCSFSGGTVTAPLGTVPPAAGAIVTIHATAPAVSVPTFLRNIATVTDTINGVTTNGNQAESTTTVNPAAPPNTSKGGGPPGADVWAIAIDTVSDDTIYIGTAAGRIYKTTSSAADWTLSAIIPGPAGTTVQALVIDPTNRNNIYAGTNGAGAIFKTSDAGQNWAALPTSGLWNAIVKALAADSAGSIYAGTAGGGVFKSVDGGNNWSASSSGLSSLVIDALLVDYSNPAILYAGTDDGFVFKSTDGGATWTASSSGVTAGSIRTFAIDPTNPTTLYAGGPGANGGVFKSTDGGATWADNNRGYLTNRNVNALVIDPLNATTLVAGTDGGVYLWTGTAWSPNGLGAPDPRVQVRALTIAPLNSPLNPPNVYAGTKDGVFRTGIGSTAWSAANNGLTNTFIRALAVSTLRPGRVYAAATAGTLDPGSPLAALFLSANGGASWSSPFGPFGYPLDLGISSLAMIPTVPTSLYAGSDTGWLFKSTDGGTNWFTYAYARFGILNLAISPANPTVVYAGTALGVFKSSTGEMLNNGLTNTNVQALAIDPSNASTFYAGTPAGVFKSTNEGANWNLINSGLSATDVRSIAIDPSNSAIVYVGTVAGVFKSVNGGAGWGAANAGLTSAVAVLAIDPAHPGTIYAGTSIQGGIFKSIDAGASWTASSTGLANVQVTSLALGASGFLYAGTQGAGVIKTFDGGTTWQPLGTQLNYESQGAGSTSPPTALSKVSGDNQTGGIGKSLSNPFVVVVTDAGGSPLADVTVNFAVASGGGTLSASSVVTDSLGLASSIFTLGPAAGPNTVSASSGTLAGSPLTFTAQGAALADLTVGVSDTPDPVTSGGTVTYTVSVQNVGSASATNVVITNTLPAAATFQSCSVPCTPSGSAVTVNVGTLAAGSAATFNVAVTAPVVTNPTFLTNTVVVLSNAIEASSTNNQAEATTLVNPTVLTPSGGGPPGGSIEVIAIDPRDTNTIYAGTDDNGIFKSTDGGANWTSMGLPQTPVRGIVIDPVNPAILYAGTIGSGNIGGGVYKSVDGGASWTVSFSDGGVPSGSNALVMDPFDSSMIYSGERKTADAGAGWIGLGAQDTALALATDPVNPGTIYAGGSGTVSKSVYWGASWTSGYDRATLGGWGTTAPVSALVVDPSNPSNVYAATITDGIYKSVDGGTSFTKISNDGSGLTNPSVKALAIDPLHTSRVYAGTSGSGVFKSENGGLTWAPANVGIAYLTVQALAIDPAITSTIYAGTTAGVFKSTSEGANWIPVNSGIVAMAARSISIDPVNPANLYAGTGGGIFKSTNGGKTWISDNAGLVNTNVFEVATDASNPYTLYAGTDAGIFKSVNGAANWTYLPNWINPFTSGQLVPSSQLHISSLAIDPSNTSILYAGLTSAAPMKLFKSVDAGQTWTGVQGLNAQGFAITALAIDQTSPTTIYSSSSNLNKSFDAGATWTQLIISLGANQLVIDPLNDNRLFAAAGQLVLVSLNAGVSWAGIGQASYTIPSLAIDPTGSNLYAGTNGGGVFKLLTGGTTWTANSVGLTNLNISSLAIDPVTPSTVYAGTGSGVFKSTDGAATWQPTGTSLSPGTVPATTISKVAGDNQSRSAGDTLVHPFVVVAINAGGLPVAGVQVTFAATLGGGHVSTSSTTTDSQGVASTTLTLGITPGNNTVTVTSAGLNGSPITFTAVGNTSISASVTALSQISGNNQSGIAGQMLQSPFVVRATDITGQPVAGLPVVFTVTQGGGSFGGGSPSTLQVTTNDYGIAASILTLGPSPGLNSATASVPGLVNSLTFVATGSMDPNPKKRRGQITSD